jgi:murein DD-endopeptidase MepM/ murein hydrolase activator NlpD
MRFAPVAPNKDSYQNDWYIAQGFGNATTYGRHEGIDLNLKTGGDSDLGQPLYALSNGQIVYYHYGSHPSSGFGRHLVVRIDGAWGTRWCMYSHCGESGFLNSVQNVTEGQKIAELGKSGNSPSAHLHFSIWKVDPSTNGGIDSFAHNDTELNQKWENPIDFINKWTQPIAQPIVITDQTLIPIGGSYGSPELQQVRSMLVAKDNDINDKNNEISNLKNKIQNAKNALA